jgi:hypothetical protein
MKQIGTAAALWIVAAVLSLLAASPVLAAASQRMLLATGCYSLEPGGENSVIAYCLDQTLPAPAPGVVLTEAPPSFGTTAIRVDGGPPMSLQAALAAKVIQIEGVDLPGVRFRNLTNRKVEICVLSPTVVAERGNANTIDLRRKYDEVAKVLADADPKPRRIGSLDQSKVQAEVWQVIAKVDDAVAGEQAAKALERSLAPLLMRTPNAQAPPPPQQPPARLPECDIRANMLTMCVERR